MSKKRIATMAAFIILSIVIIIGGYFIWGKGDIDEAENQYQPSPLAVNKEDHTEEEYSNDINFDELQTVNKDIYGWIRIPGTNIDYPILCNEEDGYYLERNDKGEKDNAGAIFTDKYNSNQMTDPVTVIYGHNLASINKDTMFTALHQYEDPEFFKENPYIYIYLPNETLKYQIFSATAFDDRYILSAYDFTKADEFTKYIARITSGITGIVDDNIQPQYGNPVITLSTCYDVFPDQRWLVNGVLIEKTSIK